MAVRDADADDLFRERVVLLLDEFSVTGVNGTHVCMIFEVTILYQYEPFCERIPFDEFSGCRQEVRFSAPGCYITCTTTSLDISRTVFRNATSYKNEGERRRAGSFVRANIMCASKYFYRFLAAIY